MKRAYYFDTIKNFLVQSLQYIFGEITLNDQFSATDLQKNAWRKEIEILKEQLKDFDGGEIIFEYTIPRIGSRIDIVLLIKGIIFLLEFKVGDDKYTKYANDQVMDYALDLKYFHQMSQDRHIVPIIVSTKADMFTNNYSVMEDKIIGVLRCNEKNIGETIKNCYDLLTETNLCGNDWINSTYMPTPTIVEAAQALYRGHNVTEISRSDAGALNLKDTTEAVCKIIERSKKNNRKSICFITGVPGAGKTLAGLNIANKWHNFKENEHAVFLSGNQPLVEVLQEALARDKCKQEKVLKKEALRETSSFIQIIHKFRDEALKSPEAPIEKIAIFDEAQRAWNEDSLSKFMAQKKGVSDFNMSEPEFLISIMDRHPDWAVIICLVGGGQEIYTGEAGIGDWFETLRRRYSDWDIYLSGKITDSEYIGKSSIADLLAGRQYQIMNELHLAVSLRSFRSENLAVFTKTLLDNQPREAYQIYRILNDKYPIVITRNFEKAKRWVKSKARGSERYGLLASSGGKRLRAEGIWVPAQINHVSWFLNGSTDVDSSYYLEVAASEFKVQGLELDYAILAWDANFRYENRDFHYFRFMSSQWQNIRNEQNKAYLKNAYRVLLTRARQGLIIYIPKGCADDPTILPEYYNGTYEYFKEIGIQEI